MPNAARAALGAGLCLLLLASALAATGELGFSRSVTPGLIARYAGQFGSGVRGRLEAWKGLVRGNANRAEAERNGSAEVELLGRVNRFFNGLPPGLDIKLWGVDDYWATPAEFQSIGAGDCEDYVIGKYFTLKELGVPISRLRLVYATTTWSPSGHLVLAYYPSPRAEPLILDNLIGGIEPASRRPDLTPVFTFNDDDLVTPGKDAMGTQLSGPSVRQWQVLTEKLERELAY